MKTCILEQGNSSCFQFLNSRELVAASVQFKYFHFYHKKKLFHRAASAKFWIVSLLFILCTSCSTLQSPYAQSFPLDEAIRQSARKIEDNLERGATVAVLAFNSSSPRLSNYVLNGISSELANNNRVRVTVRDPKLLEEVRRELNFNMTVEVIQSSAQTIGKMLGAQYIVVGLIEDMNTHYIINFWAVEVESATISRQPQFDVRKDRKIKTLIGGIDIAISYGAMNIAFGLGSYLQGDRDSGLIISGAYLVSAGLIIWERVGFTYDDAFAGIPGTIGLGLAGATLVFGFIRPIMIDSRDTKIASIMDKVHIVPVAAGQRINALGIYFTHKF